MSTTDTSTLLVELSALQCSLAELEHAMSELCARRRKIVTDAEAVIKRANKEFDRAALPLGRKITQLREWLESESQKQPASPYQTQPALPLDAGSLDPEWSQEDRDHYIELRRRATNGR